MEIILATINTISSGIFAEVQASWQQDTNLASIVEKLQHGESVKHYTYHQSQLRRKGKLVVGNIQKLRDRLVSSYHSTPTGGHSGIHATYQLVATLFYWRGLWKSVRGGVRTCSICQRFKTNNSPYPGLLQPLPVPQTLFSDSSMDFITGLPKSLGKEVIFVVVDRLTKYGHFFALSHPYSAMDVAKVFMDGVFKLHGFPTTIVLGRDPHFLSNF